MISARTRIARRRKVHARPSSRRANFRIFWGHFCSPYSSFDIRIKYGRIRMLGGTGRRDCTTETPPRMYEHTQKRSALPWQCRPACWLKPLERHEACSSDQSVPDAKARNPKSFLGEHAPRPP